MKSIERAGSDNLKLTMRLHQQNQNSGIGTDEIFGIEVSCLRREIDTDRIHGGARQIESLLVLFDPRKDFFPRLRIVGSGQGMAWRVPEICSRHDLRHCQVHHGLPGINVLVSVPRIVQNPGRFPLRKGSEGMHADLVTKPIKWSA